MKKLTKVLMLAAVFAVFAFAPVSESEVKPVPTEPKEVLMADEDLRCVIKDSDGNVLVSCWFCDCAAIAEALVP